MQASDLVAQSKTSNIFHKELKFTIRATAHCSQCGRFSQLSQFLSILFHDFLNPFLMSSPDQEILPAVQHLRRTFNRIFGSLAKHAAYNHRVATTLVPRILVDSKVVPLTQDKSKFIQNSPELAHWADDPPFGSRGKLLIIPPNPLFENVRPRGWCTAEILNQAIPSKLNGRPTVVLHHWCRGRDPMVLLPNLIMQLIESPVFNACPELRLRNGPTPGLPGPYALQACEEECRISAADLEMAGSHAGRGDRVLRSGLLRPLGRSHGT